MSEAFIALGSNLGESPTLLARALDDIDRLPGTRITGRSHWYRSAPVGGPVDQPDYLNAACRIITDLEPEALLRALQRIEREHGRVRKERWGPRTLDLDIIVYDAVRSDDPELTLPHPRAHRRAFVLYPLADLDADLDIQGQAVRHWLDNVADQAIERF